MKKVKKGLSIAAGLILAFSIATTALAAPLFEDGQGEALQAGQDAAQYGNTSRAAGAFTDTMAIDLSEGLEGWRAQFIETYADWAYPGGGVRLKLVVNNDTDYSFVFSGVWLEEDSVSLTASPRIWTRGLEALAIYMGWAEGPALTREERTGLLQNFDSYSEGRDLYDLLLAMFQDEGYTYSSTVGGSFEYDRGISTLEELDPYVLTDMMFYLQSSGLAETEPRMQALVLRSLLTNTSFSPAADDVRYQLSLGDRPVYEDAVWNALSFYSWAGQTDAHTAVIQDVYGDVVIEPGESYTMYMEWGYNAPVLGNTFNGGMKLRFDFGLGFDALEPEALYSVAYDANFPEGVEGQGSVPVDGNAYEAGAQVQVAGPEGLRAEGYVFRGWAFSADAQRADLRPGESFEMEGDVTLYAVWKKTADSSSSSSSSAVSSSSEVSSSGSSSSSSVVSSSSEVSSSGSSSSSSVVSSSSEVSSSGSSSSSSVVSSSSEVSSSGGSSSSSVVSSSSEVSSSGGSSSSSAVSSSSEVSSSGSSSSSSVVSSSSEVSSSSSSSSLGEGAGNGGNGGGSGSTGSSSTGVSRPAASSSAVAVAAVSSSAVASSSSEAPASSSAAVSSGTSSAPVELEDMDTPLGLLETPKGSWSLISLLLGVVCLLGSLLQLVFLLTALRREGEESKGNGRVRRLLAVVAGILPMTLFLILDELSAPMAMVNKWTFLVLLFAVLHAAAFLIAQMWRGREEVYEEED